MPGQILYLCEMKKYLLLFFSMVSLAMAGQVTQYFNKVYNPMGSFARGRGITEIDGHYYCLVNTFDSSQAYQSFLFMKLDGYGEVAQQKLFHIPGNVLYPGTVGGTLKKTFDGNLVFAYHADGNSTTYSSLVKFNPQLDTIWKKDFFTENIKTMTMNCQIVEDGGYILSGSVKPEEGSFWDFLLLKTDNLGNEQWHQSYGTDWHEQGTNAIQTPDGGYLMGGYFWKPGTDHSLDAMVVKTDSLGNEQWTKYFGNPDIDDDMAFVQMAGDGNYIVATVYGEEIITSDERRGRVAIMKIDTLGNLISINKFGPNKIANHIKNFKNNNGHYITSGYYYVNEGLLFKGWGLKLSLDIDSVWMFDYTFFNEQDDRNYLYDIAPTSDNGYIAIGSANVGFTQSNMWILKVDSMGCDTPGCVTGTWVRQLFPYERERGEVLQVWPNPARDRVTLSLSKCAAGKGKAGTITVYDPQGIKTEEIKIPENTESIEVDVSVYQKGIYYLQYVCSGKVMGNGKFIKE